MRTITIVRSQPRQLSASTGRFRRGWRPPKEPFGAEVLINVRPVDAEASAADLPVPPLLRRGTEEPRVPNQGYSNRASADEVDRGLLDAEQREALSAAFRSLPSRCQQVLRLLMNDPAPSYVEVAAALDMPIGSIGPTRQRCLDQLRRVVAADSALADPGAPAGGTA